MNARRSTILLGVLCALLVLCCTPADIAAEKRAIESANSKINAYCDARAKALEALGEAGAKQ